MIAFYSLLIVPPFSALIMLIIGGKKISGYFNILVALINFVASLFVARHFLLHGTFTAIGQYFYIDAFNSLMIVSTTFILMSTAFFSKTYMWHIVSINRINKLQLLLYHFMYQIFTLAILITLTTNNLGILWVAMEAATLATVLLVSMYRSKEALEAAWKYFILCIIGITLALFGTVLTSFSSVHALPPTDSRILWNILIKHAGHFDPTIIKIAFIFIFVGYGTKIGLVPFHNWLPDAYTEAPTPVTVLLAAVLSNISLYALIRFKILIDSTLNNNLTGILMVGFGLLSFVVGAAFLKRQYKMKRLFSYSSIEQIGLITIAFGIGGKTATYIALFYMLINALAKSAAFMVVGNVIQQTGTQVLEKVRGLIKVNPGLGSCLIIITLAVAGMPPFGIFTSKLLIMITSIDFSPVLTVVLILGSIYALSGLLSNIQPSVFGEVTTNLPSKPLCTMPIWVNIGIIFILGVYQPPILQQLLRSATELIIR
jgi:hydrogenase-4 component F